MRVIRANSHAFGTHICNRVRALPTIPSRSETRPGQCIPTRIIHRGHYRPRQDKGFIIDLRLIVTLWITHACVRMRVHVCTQHTQPMCMHVTDLLLICQGMLIERGDRETYEPAISCFLTVVGIRSPRK